MKILIKKTHAAARIPEYMTDGAAAFDLYAATVNEAEYVGDVVYPGHPVVCDTGLAFEVPEGYALRIASRSGFAFKHGVTAFPGVIDSDFRGSVKVLLTCTHVDHKTLKINPGDRIAQGMIVKVPRCEFVECEELSETERGGGGFGSTGAA